MCLRQWSSMTASAANSRFLIASDLAPGHPVWPAALTQVEDIRQACARILGFDPHIALQPIEELALEPGCETFVIPAALDFSLLNRESLGHKLAEARRHPNTEIYHDDVAPGHPLVVSAFSDVVGRAISELGMPARKCGLLLTSS